MADRKQTPDILAEILSGTPATQPAPAPARASRPASKAPARAKSPRKTTQPLPVKDPIFQYRVVSFQDHRGWRARFENGSEIEDWMGAPLIHDYIAQAALDGWELVAASAGERLYGAADRRQLYFRRPE